MSAADRLRELAANATPGPWENPLWGEPGFGDVLSDTLTVARYVTRPKDAALIAAAPDLAVLLARALDELDHGYWDVTTHMWRCNHCERTDDHDDHCAVGALLADADRALGDVT